MSSQPDALPEVFISYAHEDREYKDELVKQLDVLVQVGKISCWHDGELVAGDQWDDKIKEHLSSSNLILLLVSPDFTFSSYIREVEVQKAIERYKAGAALVIPVLVRNIHGWKELPFGELKLGGLQAVPTHEEYTFITEWPNPDAAFENVAAGIEEAVDKLRAQEVVPPPPANLPPPPLIDFVERKDREGRYIVKRLIGELSPPNKRLIALTGQGGVGKTTIAAEVVRAMTSIFPGRIVWASAEQRADFNFSTLLDEIATQLGKRELSTLALNRKEEAVRVLLAISPTMIVLDNFETVQRDEQTPCAEFLLRRAQCPALITTRQRVPIARNIPVDSMSHEEAQEFLERFISQMQDPQIFTAEVRQRIIETAEARPFVMQWVVAQIDQEAQEPDVVLKELSQGEGDAAERVFDRSFNLPQLGDDGRAALLALSLFVSGATRNALAEVAGFGDDENRLNEAVKSLRALSLIIGKGENQRLAVEGLTRSLAGARLSKDERANEFRQRFVAYFLRYANAHPQPTPEDYAALEAEKDNLLYAIDVAFNLSDWESLQQITRILANPVTGVLSVHGYWDEAIRRWDQALKAAHNASSEPRVARIKHNVAIIYQYRGELTEARRLYDESLEINRRLGDQSGIASALHQLGRLAQEQGELTEARRLYDESLEINRRLGDQSGIAGALHNLAMLAQARRELTEARRLYDESLEIERGLGNQSVIASTLHELGRLAQARRELTEARRLYDESLEIKKRLGNQSGIAITLGQLGLLAKEEGNKAEAIRLLHQALSIFEKLRSPHAETARRVLERLEGESS
ncbi:MAG TPA: tetratricopeptide repeat protein [Pyrinomonadaceae bacterium]